MLVREAVQFSALLFPSASAQATSTFRVMPRRTSGEPTASGRALELQCQVIPMWYRFGMSKQIAVRLPDDIVDFIDQLVDNGQASSRAVVVARAIDRERRRAVAARDAAILARLGTDSDLDSLAEHAARTPLDDLD
jgi:Arc/MetJ-type ribon-helix-helix transcriptional regulator